MNDAKREKLRISALCGAIILIALFAPVLLTTKNNQSASSKFTELLKAFIGPPEHTKIDPNAPLTSQTRIVRIGGRRFEVPIMYLASPLQKGEEQSSLLFEVIWPDMRSIHNLTNREEYERIRSQEHRLGWIFVEAETDRPSLEWQHNNSISHLTKLVPAGLFEGMEKSLWYRGSKDSPRLWADVYLEKDANGNVIGFVRCRRGDGVHSPLCRYRFTSENLVFSITFSESKFFRDRKELRENSIDFMQHFEILEKP